MDVGRIVDVACRRWPNTRAVQSERVLSRLVERDLSIPLRSRAINAMGVWSSIADPAETCRPRDLFEAALSIEPGSQVAAKNLAALSQDNAPSDPPVRVATVTAVSPTSHQIDPNRALTLARMLGQARYDVTHFVVRFACAPLTETIDIPHQIIQLKSSGHESEFQGAIADALRGFNPDFVLVYAPAVYLPLLAAAALEFPYLLGPDALDLYPLLERNMEWAHAFASGPHSLLHGPGTIAFDDQMRQALWDAEEVLVCTPEGQMRLAPHARSVRVVPWGINSVGFTEREAAPSILAIRLCIVLTGKATDTKGVDSILRHLSNFSDPDTITFAATVLSPSTSSSVESSHRIALLRSADIILFPEETPSAESVALIVEAMACGRPVVVPRNASTRYLLSDGVEGMMFEPALPMDRTRVVHQLASNAQLRKTMGDAGRSAATRRFGWQVIIERGYRPIFQRR